MSDAKEAAARPNRNRGRRVMYESAGPAQLAAQPGDPKPQLGRIDPEWSVLKQHLEARLNMLRSWRFSWAQHWQLLESYILPRRGIFINTAMPTPNTMIRGLPINQNILDPTGTYAMRRCAAGMMSGLMSPSRPWFKLKSSLGPRDELDQDAQIWFEEVEKAIYEAMADSNFYDAGAQMFEDLVTFGSGPVIIYEDEADTARAYVPCPGEYFLGSSSAMRVETFYRLFVMTVSQIVEMFGVEACPVAIQSQWQTKGSALEVEYLVAHAIEPNFPIHMPGNGEVGVVPGDFEWREVYWIWGQSDLWPLSTRGFIDQPFICPRWATTSNDAYGRSVAMDVLPDIMQLQTETARKAEAIEKQVRPPMLASMELKNEPSSILPGKVTFVNNLSSDKGMRPIFTVQPELNYMTADLKEIQQRVREGFFNDLFMMLETASNKNMTAYEVAQRQQEKLQVLGPVVERLQNEALEPAIKRFANILARKGRLPEKPESLQQGSVGIEYVGMLSLAQKAATTASLERFAGVMGNMQQADPSARFFWNREAWAREYGDSLLVPKGIMNSPEQIAAAKQAEAQQQAQLEATQTAMTAIQGAEGLSKIEVGGGINAVQAMLGTGPGGP